MTDFDSEDIPSFRAWRSQFRPPPDAAAYLAEHLNVTAAALFSELMCPDLTFVRGCVILTSRYRKDNFEQWWAQEDGNVSAIEAVVNHVHLWDIFEPVGEIEERALESLARRMARSWALHAESQFPDRIFVAEVTDEYGPTVVLRTEATVQP